MRADDRLWRQESNKHNAEKNFSGRNVSGCDSYSFLYISGGFLDVHVTRGGEIKG